MMFLLFVMLQASEIRNDQEDNGVKPEAFELEMKCLRNFRGTKPL